MPKLGRTVPRTKMGLQGNWGSEQRREDRVRARRHGGTAVAALGRAIERVAAVPPGQRGSVLEWADHPKTSLGTRYRCGNKPHHTGFERQRPQNRPNPVISG
jgi:hypothetical protein